MRLPPCRPPQRAEQCRCLKPEFLEQIPMQRYGDSLPEIASVFAFLASSGAAYITGQNIRVDGGITRSV